MDQTGRLKEALSRPATVSAPVGSPRRGTRAREVEQVQSLRWWFVCVFVAALLPRLWTAGRYVTADEPNWMDRTVRFSDAITQFRFNEASASLGEVATMPGVPTMWIGSAARFVWGVADRLGIIDSESFKSPEGMATAQYLAAIVTALLVGWLFVAVARWVGLVPALLASLLVATDPWWAALGAVLHTDELTALFGCIGLVCLARALRLPESAPAPKHPTRLAALAGLALMLAPLTKVTGVGYWTGVAVLAIWAFMRHRRAGGAVWERTSPLRLCVVAGLVGLVSVPVLWPAIVADPSLQIERLVAAAEMGSEPGRNFRGSRQFYMGERVNSPDWTFYFVASAMRATPWLLVVLVVGVPAALLRRVPRSFSVTLLVPAAAIMFVITRAPKSYDRYVLLVTIPLVVVAAIGLCDLVGREQLQRPVVRKVALGLGAVMVLHSLWVAPWGLAYYNPITGGSRGGQDNLLVGWGEGKEIALERIREREGGCKHLSVAGVNELARIKHPCAAGGFAVAGADADYLLLYVNQIQRRSDLADAVEGRELVDVVVIRGIPYVEIWQ